MNVGGGGNDAAFDNLGLLDITAQLDQSIVAGPLGGAWAVGEIAPMTFTITNTHLAEFPIVPSGARSGMTFSATLPAGLRLTGPATTDCPNGVVVESPVGVLTGTADLDALTPSCTLAVGVTSDVAGTFPITASSMQLVGLLAPADVSVTFASTLPPTGPTLTSGLVVAAGVLAILGAIMFRLRARRC